MLGLWGVALLAVVYPLGAASTQQPLAIFVIPLLLTATVGSWRQTAIVGVVAFLVALVEGLAQEGLDTAGLAARMTIIGVTACAGIVGAFERERRQQVIDDSQHVDWCSTRCRTRSFPRPFRRRALWSV
jgi:hypothetical protein